MNGFHEITFPTDISLSCKGGPQRLTDVVTLGFGREERNQKWFHSRRRYDAGYGIKTLQAIAQVTEFFEERRGMLHGFRWRDRMDHRSCLPNATPSATDQPIAIGDGTTAVFQLIKKYGSAYAPYKRDISKPVAGSVRVAINGAEVSTNFYTVNSSTGQVTFLAGHVPAAGAVISAGYLFDVPVRFDADYLEIDMAGFEAGDIPKIPVIEILEGV